MSNTDSKSSLPDSEFLQHTKVESGQQSTTSSDVIRQTPPEVVMIPTKSIPLRLTRGKQRATMLGHASTAVILILLGVEGLLDGEGAHLLVSITDIVIGSIVLISMRRELNHKGGHRGIRWVDILAGVMIIWEAWHKYNPAKGFQPAALILIIGLITIALGVFHDRIPKSRRLVLEPDGFLIRTSPFRRLRVRWKEISGVVISDNMLTAVMKAGGRRTISLKSIVNQEEIRKAIEEYAPDVNPVPPVGRP